MYWILENFEDSNNAGYLLNGAMTQQAFQAALAHTPEKMIGQIGKKNPLTNFYSEADE